MRRQGGKNMFSSFLAGFSGPHLSFLRRSDNDMRLFTLLQSHYLQAILHFYFWLAFYIENRIIHGQIVI